MEKVALRDIISEYSVRNKVNGDYKVYSVTNSHGFIPSEEYFSKEVYSKDLSNYKIVKNGMLAYNPSRINVGSVAVQRAMEQVIVSPLYVVFQVDGKKAMPEYIYYFLQSPVGLAQIAAHTSGSVRDSLKIDALKTIEINLYSLEEQREIINKLQKLQNLIDKQQLVLKKLDDLVKSQFIEMFGSYPQNPKNWTIVTIRDIVEDVRYGTSRPAVEGGKYPYLRMNNITYSGELDLTDVKRIDVPDSELAKCIVRRGDVLFNRTNSRELVGKTCVYNCDETMVLAGFVIRVRVKNNVLPEFLVAFLNTDFSKKMLYRMCKEAIGQANINAQEMQNISIYLPPIELQKEFLYIKQQTDKSKFRIKQSLEKLETCYKALLQKYFG